MKIKVKSDELVDVLRKLGKIATDGEGVSKNFRVEASNIVKVYVSTGQAYGEAIVPSGEVIEDGMIALPLTSIPVFSKIENTVELSLQKNSYKVTATGIDLTLSLLSSEPEMIAKRKYVPEWTGNSYDRLLDILWATGQQTYERDVIWIADGKFICGDGIKFVVYDVNCGYDNVVINTNFIKYFTKGTKTDVHLHDTIFYIGNDNYNISINIVQDAQVPNPIRELIKAPLNTEFCLVNKNRLSGLSSLSKILSEQKDNPACTIKLENNKLEFIPGGNQIGTGELSMNCTESYGSFEIKVNSKILDLMVTKLEYDPVIALTRLYNMDLLTLIDGNVKNYLVPLV